MLSRAHFLDAQDLSRNIPNFQAARAKACVRFYIANPFHAEAAKLISLRPQNSGIVTLGNVDLSATLCLGVFVAFGF